MEWDGDFFRRWMTTTAELIEEQADRLTELDSAIGDADHGDNLRRGFRAVVAAQEAQAKDQAKDQPNTPGAVLTLAGRTLIASVGGASGPLYGTLLRRAGKALGEAETADLATLREALDVGLSGVARLGGAVAGDKTMLDALKPAVEALDSGPRAAAEAARQGALETIPLLARKGRASYLGERSVGHQDPGATSVALLIEALEKAATDG